MQGLARAIVLSVLLVLSSGCGNWFLDPPSGIGAEHSAGDPQAPAVDDAPIPWPGADPPRLPSPHVPAIETVTWDAQRRVLTVFAADRDTGERLTVVAAPSDNLKVYPPTARLIASWPAPGLPAEFHVEAAKPGQAVSGTLEVQVFDASGQFAIWPELLPVAVPARPIPQPVAVPARATPPDMAPDGGGSIGPVDLAALAPGTLYALPLAERVAAGQPVRVLFATGTLPNRLEYVNGVGVVMPSDARYVPLSFDFGAPDALSDAGGAVPLDGIWTQVRPADGFLFADALICATPLGENRQRWDFNITPLGGQAVVGARGALFSAEFTFSTPGRKVFGFAHDDAIPRTYYSDYAREHFWSDLSNRGGPGLPNAVLVE